MFEILRKAFIDPFTSGGRMRLYLGAVFGCIGFAGLIMYFAFDFLHQGPVVLAAYFLTKSLIGNVFFMPALFWAAQRLPERAYFTWLMVIQGIVLALMVFVPFDDMEVLHRAFAFGLLFTLFSGPYWLFYHALMIHSSTDHNLANEVSIAAIGTSIGSIFGYFIGGIIFAFLPGTWFVMFCFVIMVASAALLVSAIPKEPPASARKGSMLRSLLSRPWRSLNTVMDGALNFLTSFFEPFWLGFIGLSSVATGTVTALGVLSRLVLSPITGHWFHTTKLRESKVGSAMITAGWVPWVAVQSPWVLIWSFFFWTTGSHMYSVGLQSRWYQDKTYANMGAREICLGVGRTITCILGLILIHMNVTAFFAMALAIGLTAFLVTLRESRS